MTLGDFSEALQTTQPSTAEIEHAQYAAWNDEYGSRSSTGTTAEMKPLLALKCGSSSSTASSVAPSAQPSAAPSTLASPSAPLEEQPSPPQQHTEAAAGDVVVQIGAPQMGAFEGAVTGAVTPRSTAAFAELEAMRTAKVREVVRWAGLWQSETEVWSGHNSPASRVWVSHLDDAEMAAILSTDQDDVEGLCSRLIAAANRGGGVDNITAVIIRLIPGV